MTGVLCTVCGAQVYFSRLARIKKLTKLSSSGFTSCQVSLYYVHRCHRKIRKCLRKSEARGHLLFFRSAQKYKLCRGRCDLASWQASLNSVQRFQRINRKCLSHSEVGRLFCFSDRPEKHKHGRGRTLRSCFLSSVAEFCSAILEEKSKMSLPIKGRSGHLVFPIGSNLPKNTNLVDDVAILLLAKFCWIPFSCFRGEVENVKS